MPNHPSSPPMTPEARLARMIAGLKEADMASPFGVQMVGEDVVVLICLMEDVAAEIATLRGELDAAEQHVRILQAQLASAQPAPAPQETADLVDLPPDEERARLADGLKDIAAELKQLSERAEQIALTNSELLSRRER